MKKLIALALTLVLSLSMAACSSNTTISDPTTPSTTKDGVLKLATTTGDGFSTDDKVPTPWNNRTFATNLMFRSLFIADSTLTKTSPDLASEYSISDDGLTYNITLKDGLKWSDGQPITVDDVIWSIESSLKTSVINPIYTVAFDKISKISADGNVIEMTLSTPYSSMLDTLAQFAILPKHKLEQSDLPKLDSDPFWLNPVSSGMYVINEFKIGNYFTLKPNENYEGASPKIKNVTISFVSDFVTAAQAGTADYIHGNAADLVNALSSMPNYTSHEVEVFFYKYFLFNMKGIDGKENIAMQNVAVRKALMKAIDRASLADLYPNANVLHSGVSNNDPAYNGFEYVYDVEKAKEEIKSSGYDMARPIKICYYNNDQTSIDLINTIVYYLEQIGLKVEATLSNDGTTDLFTTRDYDIGFKGKSAFSINEWYIEYLSGDALFSKVFGGDTSFDNLVAELSATTNESERSQVLKKMQDLEQEKVYKVPLFTVGTYVFTNNNLKIPSDVAFCNPLYNSDIDFANWEIV